MGNYDDIQVPSPNIPLSSSLFGVKARNAIIALDARLAIIEANLTLPASVSAMGNGINTVTAAAATWQNLASFPAAPSFTNPSANYDLLVDVTFGAWMQATAGDGRMGVALSGGVTQTVGPGTNQPTGWGLFPMTTITTADQHTGYFQVLIPKGVAAVTFTAQGYRSNGSATVQINYPTIHIVPRRYQ